MRSLTKHIAVGYAVAVVMETVWRRALDYRDNL
jgi:hypothetical protein